MWVRGTTVNAPDVSSLALCISASIAASGLIRNDAMCLAIRSVPSTFSAWSVHDGGVSVFGHFDGTESAKFAMLAVVAAVVVVASPSPSPAPSSAPSAVPTFAPTLQPTRRFNNGAAFVRDWALVGTPAVGCSNDTALYGYPNPVRVLVDAPVGNATIGSNYRVWQAQYTLLTTLTAAVGRYAPVYTWFNVSQTVSPTLRFVDVWVCTVPASHLTAGTESQLYRRCGPPVTHLAYALGCNDTTTPYQACTCTDDTAYRQLTAPSCDAMCAAESKNCTAARFRCASPPCAPSSSPSSSSPFSSSPSSSSSVLLFFRPLPSQPP